MTLQSVFISLVYLHVHICCSSFAALGTVVYIIEGEILVYVSTHAGADILTWSPQKGNIQLQ